MDTNHISGAAEAIIVIKLCTQYTFNDKNGNSKSQFNSLEFALHGSFMKIFNTRSKEIANYCMEMFNVQNPHYTITKRKCKFLSNITSSKNVLCELCREFAQKGTGIVCASV